MKAWLFVLAACSGSGGSAQPAEPAQPSSTSPPPKHHAQPLGHRFEKADEWAKIFDDPKRDAWQQPARVVELLALKPGMAVADIGAGTGYFEKRLAKAVGPQGSVIAIDVEPDMVRYLKERAEREGTKNVEARLATADDPKLTPVDRVLIVDTWHHIPERAAYSKKLAAALKPGGFVLVVDFTMTSPKGPPKEHRIPPEQVLKELEQGGLHGVIVPAGLTEQYVIRGAK